MNGGATPEELETLLEDAYLMRDDDTLLQLFEGHVAFKDWQSIARFVAERHRLTRSGDIALLLGDESVAVLRRGSDRGWRYAVVTEPSRSASQRVEDHGRPVLESIADGVGDLLRRHR